MRRLLVVLAAAALCAVPGPVMAAEPEPGSCYAKLPADGWDFNSVSASRVDCSAGHKFEVYSVFSLPQVSGPRVSDRQRLYSLTYCANEIATKIGLTSSASHYALEVTTDTAAIKGVCTVVSVGSKPDTPITVVGPYTAANLEAPLCLTDLLEFVRCDSRSATSKLDSAKLFYPLSTITDATPFPGHRTTSKRAARMATKMTQRTRYGVFAPRTRGLWNSHVRMVFVYHNR